MDAEEAKRRAEYEFAQFYKRVPEKDKHLYCEHGHYKGAVPEVIPKGCHRCGEQDRATSPESGIAEVRR